MNNKKKKVIFYLIYMVPILIGMVSIVDAMIAKFGMIAIPVHLLVWLVLICIYIICIKKLRNK